MVGAAILQLDGFDGMRFLGADPSQPADHIERLATLHLRKRIVALQRRAMKEQAHG